MDVIHAERACWSQTEMNEQVENDRWYWYFHTTTDLSGTGGREETSDTTEETDL